MGLIDFITRTRSLTGLYLVTRPRAWYYWNFKRTTEKKYLNGQLKPIVSSASVLFYTINKAGSNVAHSLIEPELSRGGWINVDWEGYWAVHPESREKRLFSEKPDESLFNPYGFYYGPLRNYVHLKNQQAFKIIVLIRDPRDLLTSHYFSMTESHPVLTKRYLDKRMEAKKRSIDEHVLNYAPRFKKVYSDYLKHLYGQPNVLWLTYEEMVTHTNNWLTKLDEFMQTDGCFRGRLSEIESSGMFAAKKENSAAHARKILPGDHMEKLKPETIAELNRIFAEIMPQLGY